MTAPSDEVRRVREGMLCCLCGRLGERTVVGILPPHAGRNSLFGRGAGAEVCPDDDPLDLMATGESLEGTLIDLVRKPLVDTLCGNGYAIEMPTALRSLAALSYAIPFVARLMQQIGNPEPLFSTDCLTSPYLSGLRNRMPSMIEPQIGGSFESSLGQRLFEPASARRMREEPDCRYYLFKSTPAARPVELRTKGRDAPLRTWASLDEFLGSMLPAADLTALLQRVRELTDGLGALCRELYAMADQAVVSARLRSALLHAVENRKPLIIGLGGATLNHRRTRAQLVLAPGSDESSHPSSVTIELETGERECVLEWSGDFRYIPPFVIAGRILFTATGGNVQNPLVRAPGLWVHPYTGKLHGEVLDADVFGHREDILPPVSAEALSLFAGLGPSKGEWCERDICIADQGLAIRTIVQQYTDEFSKHGGAAGSDVLGLFLRVTNFGRTTLLNGHRNNKDRPRTPFEELPYRVPVFSVLRGDGTLAKRVFLSSGRSWCH